jgi:hypothetical protein
MNGTGNSEKKMWMTPDVLSSSTFERMALTCTGSVSPICNAKPITQRSLRPKGTSSADCILNGQCASEAPNQS